MISEHLLQLGIAVGLGLLVGLERERAVDEVAGIRTFPLITLLGTLTAILADEMGTGLVLAALLGVTALIIVGNLTRIRMEDLDPGITTEVAALMMFGVGVALGYGLVLVPVVLSGTLAVLLHLRDPLHDLADRIDPEEMKALIRLAVIGLVILPILPDQSFGPYRVLNPRNIWLMVVLIVGISMGAYVAYRLLGTRRGTLVAGLLGGLISSTATTVSYAQRSAGAPDRTPVAAVVVTLASTVVFLRVLLEIGLVAPGLLPTAGPPLLVLALFMTGVSWLLYRGVRRAPDPELQEREPPSELGSAVLFGALYAVILLGVAAAREHFGTGALYGVAALSGLTDVDAITLSTAQLVNEGQLEASTGWRLMVVGALANLVFKGGVVAVLGHRRLLGRIAGAFGATLVAGALLIFLWPG